MSAVTVFTLALTSLPATGLAAPISVPASSSGTSDYGLTILDLWAYMADILSTYQDAFASEAYLGTSRDRPC